MPVVMLDDCIFCKIIAGLVPSENIIYQDEKVLAFLDISPVTPGHVLLIPKEHFNMMPDTPDELIAHLFIKAKYLMQVIKKSLAADFVVMSVVGIEIPHFHIHLIPRSFDDGLANFWPSGKYQADEAKIITQKIKANL